MAVILEDFEDDNGNPIGQVGEVSGGGFIAVVDGVDLTQSTGGVLPTAEHAQMMVIVKYQLDNNENPDLTTYNEL